MLTVGTAVDANVLIYERIREEVRNGVTPQTAITKGFEKAFSAIADSNVTTLIAGIVLWVFGTGPIRGFAVVLSLGIVTSMFTSLLGSRALTDADLRRRTARRAFRSIWRPGGGPPHGILQGRHELRVHVQTKALVCAVSGADDRLDRFARHPRSEPRHRLHRWHRHRGAFPDTTPSMGSAAALQQAGFADAQVQNFGSSRDVAIRLPPPQGQTSEQVRQRVETVLRATVDPDVELKRVEVVGPQVGKELSRQRGSRCSRPWC